ncbi:hypothetical protein [Salipiger mangrovisoli]|uniref:Uncharacterized protein n=1 Tax=Salipiger mangrovisoli TaxID=2865933 RepID=A0ABR9WYC9_9RHOB|nr:hypothetical protein [Salipiger mangrovisoli]MBE9636310.1 hypothetical protein [Salipiger mangrovisoli]
MPFRARKSVIFGLALALLVGVGARAQEVLGRYTAMITPADQVNSNGQPLSQPSQILAQERANFHRFGIRQTEDTGDAYFGAREMRAELPRLLSRGQMDSAARSIVMAGGLVTVEILGQGGRPYALRVSGGAIGAVAQPPSAAPFPSAITGRWTFGRVTGVSGAVAQAGDPVVRVALECMRPDGGGAALGPLTLRVVAPAAAALPPGPVTFAAVVDGALLGSIAMTASGGSLAGPLPSGAPLVAGLRNGNRLELSMGATPVVSAGLSGSSAALSLLMDFCATPVDVPLSAALSAVPELPPVGDAAAGGTALVARAEAPIERGVVGEEAIGSRLGLWLLGQRPSLVRNRSFELAFPLPEGYPEYERPQHPGRVTMEEAYAYSEQIERGRRAYLEDLAARAAAETLPDRVTLTIPARLTRPEPGKPTRLDLEGTSKILTNYELQASVPAALRTLQMDLGSTMGRVFLRESAPLPLPLPEEIRALEPPLDPTGHPGFELFPVNDIYLRVTLALSDPQVLLPRDGEQARWSQGPSAEIAARVLEVRLFRRPRTRHDEPQAPETLLATWRRDTAAAMPEAGNLGALDVFAATYAAGVEDGRLLNLSGWHFDASGGPRTVGQMGLSPDVAAQQADLLIRANAVLERTPEREFAPDLLLRLLEQLVDPISRDGMIPPGFFGEAAALNEIARAKILRDAGPKLAAYIRARAPVLPLPVRSRGMAELGAYDISAQVFALALRGGQLAYLPTPSRNRSLDGMLDGIGDALPVPLDTAEALLTRLETDTLPGRSVPVVLDMRLVSARAVPQTMGPITLDELQRVVLTWQPERLRITADIAGTQELLTREFDPAAFGAGEGAAVPDDVYETTAETILGAWASRNSTVEDLASDILADRDFRARMGQAPQSAIEARAREQAERLIASAPDTFWIGLSVQMGSYDAAAQRIPITNVAIFPLPGRLDEGINGLPGLHFPRRAAFDHLPAAPADYDLIAGLDGGRHALLFAHVAIAEEQDRRDSLALARPDRLLFLRETGNGDVTVALSKSLEAAPRLGLAPPAAASPAGAPGVRTPAHPSGADGLDEAVPASSRPLPTFTAPEVLRLDAEGLDLLALSLQPELYDARAFRRMFIERVARERADLAAGRTPQWGRFFANPELELLPSLIEDLLPDFAAWSQARAAALPQRLRLSVGLSGPHPETGCRAAWALPQPTVADRAAVAQAAAMLPGVMPAARVSPVSDATKPGGPPLHVVLGRPSHPSGSGGTWACDVVDVRKTSSDLSEARTGLHAGAAPYVDALVAAEVPLVDQVTPSGPQAIDYLLTAEDIRLENLAPGAGDQPGLRGVLVIRASVSAVETWQFDTTTRKIVPAESYAEDAWQSLLPSRDTSAFDILGLRLGASLADVETTVADRMPGALRHVTPPAAQAGIYDHAEGFSTPDGREVILSIYDPGDEARPAVALMRYRYLPPGTATVEAVRKAVTEKYGPPDRESGDAMAWGVPSQELDPAEVCGGHNTLRGSNAPRLSAEKTRDELRAETSEGSYQPPEWGYYGWPVPLGDVPEYQRAQAETYCGPVVLARIRSDVHEPGSVDLTVWLLDKPEAERRAKAAAGTVVVPDLDMDL